MSAKFHPVDWMHGNKNTPIIYEDDMIVVYLRLTPSDDAVLCDVIVHHRVDPCCNIQVSSDPKGLSVETPVLTQHISPRTISTTLVQRAVI